jgi:hypothetical protein
LAENAEGIFSGHRARPLAKGVAFASCEIWLKMPAAFQRDIGLDRQ